MRKAEFLCALLVCVSTPVFAVEYTFTSRLDRFTVDISDGSATFNGEEIRTEPFVQVRPLFEAEFEDPCESRLGRPDVTITRKTGDKEVKRIVYIEKKIVSDGSNCGSVSGQGLYEMPLHRNWFTGKTNVTIALHNSFSIWKDDKLVVAFEKKDGRWQNKDSKFYTNWEFFNNFVSAVRDIPINYRVHTAAANASKDTNFELHQGDRKFMFVKVAEKTWAVQFPNSPWLAASGQFGFFDDMNLTIWQSPFTKTLSVLGDATAKTENRLKALKELTPNWGADAKEVFASILTTDGENMDVRKDIATVMRARPTDENFQVLLEALRKTEDQSLKHHLSRILRVRNPKGPVVEEDDDDAIVAKKVREWTTWGKTLR